MGRRVTELRRLERRSTTVRRGQDATSLWTAYDVVIVSLSTTCLPPVYLSTAV